MAEIASPDIGSESGEMSGHGNLDPVERTCDGPVFASVCICHGFRDNIFLPKEMFEYLVGDLICLSGVSTHPGETSVTVIPLYSTSLRSPLQKLLTNALVDA